MTKAAKTNLLTEEEQVKKKIVKIRSSPLVRESDKKSEEKVHECN